MIVYFGTAAFAVPALQAVASHVALVVSQPDKPSGRGLQLKPSPVKQAALELGLPVATPIKARDPEFIAEIEALGADFLLVAAYGQILSERLLLAAKHGGINLHGSILPAYRGAAPIQRCIAEGHTETGVTLMQMDKGMDTGDMIALATTRIGPDETAGEITPRLASMAAALASQWAPRLAVGDYPRTPQDHAAATHAPKIDRIEAELHPIRDAKQEYARFRGFTPAPGAWVQTRDGDLKVTQARFNTETGTPGLVLALEPLTVAFLNGALELHEVQPAGKRRMSGSDWARGARLQVGDAIGPEVSTNA